MCHFGGTGKHRLKASRIGWREMLDEPTPEISWDVLHSQRSTINIASTHSRIRGLGTSYQESACLICFSNTDVYPMCCRPSHEEQARAHSYLFETRRRDHSSRGWQLQTERTGCFHRSALGYHRARAVYALIISWIQTQRSIARVWG